MEKGEYGSFLWCFYFIFFYFTERALTNTPENLPFCIVQNLFAFWKTVMPFNNCLFSFVVDKQEARAYSKAISSYCGRWDIKQFWYTSSCGQNSILNFYACCLFVICISVLPKKKQKQKMPVAFLFPLQMRALCTFFCKVELLVWGVGGLFTPFYSFIYGFFFLMQLYFCSAFKKKKR